MTLAVDTFSLDRQHLVLDDVSWDFYEHLLDEIGDRHIFITYDQGRLEIMSPLPRHERWSQWIARLIEIICLDRQIYVESLGMTTFRDPNKQKGLEPDKCFYIQHADAAHEMNEAFDPDIDPPPDLAIEIDITHRSIDREPIYAALGVSELWRFDGKRLHVLHLSSKARYIQRKKSLAFSFLPMAEFEKFVLRMTDKDQIRTLRDFRAWVEKL
jgi:Uma2 family endonuclease